MADYRLSKTQRNDLFKIALDIGLDPAAFEWIEEQRYGNVVHRIEHPATGAFLRMVYVSVYAGDARFHFDDYQPRTVDLEAAHESDWPKLRLEIARWFQAVKLEDDAPDLWEVARDEKAWLTSTEEDFEGNTPFTAIEQERIAASLKTIEEYAIKTYELNAEHKAHVEARLKYLTEAADRVGRFDWKNLAAATFIDIVVTLGLDLEKAQKIWSVCARRGGPNGRRRNARLPFPRSERPNGTPSTPSRRQTSPRRCRTPIHPSRLTL